MNIFDVSEIFQFAIRIEENGEKFYRYAVQIAEDEEARDMFNHLADEEVNHKKIFEEILSGVKKYEPPESYPDEYFAYLKAYVDDIIFNKELRETDFSKIENTSSAIDFALQRELDSILYYYEVKHFVTERQHSLIDKIIEEERKHVLKLSTAKRKL